MTETLAKTIVSFLHIDQWCGSDQWTDEQIIAGLHRSIRQAFQYEPDERDKPGTSVDLIGTSPIPLSSIEDIMIRPPWHPLNPNQGKDKDAWLIMVRSGPDGFPGLVCQDIEGFQYLDHKTGRYAPEEPDDD